MRKKWIIALAVVLGVGLLAAGAGYWVVFGPNTKLFEGERSVYVPRGASFEQVVDSLFLAVGQGHVSPQSIVARLTRLVQETTDEDVSEVPLARPDYIC